MPAGDVHTGLATQGSRGTRLVVIEDRLPGLQVAIQIVGVGLEGVAFRACTAVLCRSCLGHPDRETARAAGVNANGREADPPLGAVR